MSWLAKLISRISSNSVSPTTSPRGSTTGDVSKTTSLPDLRPLEGYSETPSHQLLREAAISRALRICGVSHCRDSDFTQVAEATRNVEWITGLHIRRYGDKLSKDEVKSAGARGNSIISRQFMDILNDAGRDHPMLAADILANSINLGIASGAYLADRAGEPLEFFPSNMASGPCSRSAMIGNCTIARSEADLLPLEGCDRIDQCACRYLPAKRQYVPVELTPEEQALADEILSEIQIGISFGTPQRKPFVRPARLADHSDD